MLSHRLLSPGRLHYGSNCVCVYILWYINFHYTLRRDYTPYNVIYRGELTLQPTTRRPSLTADRTKVLFRRSSLIFGLRSITHLNKRVVYYLYLYKSRIVSEWKKMIFVYGSTQLIIKVWYIFKKIWIFVLLHTSNRVGFSVVELIFLISNESVFILKSNILQENKHIEMIEPILYYL